MTRRVATASIVEAVAGGLALLAAVVTGDVALVALGAPLALAAVLGLAAEPPRQPDIEVVVSPLVVSSDSPVTVVVTASSAVPQLCELDLVVPRDMVAAAPTRWTAVLEPGQQHRRELELTARRPGRFSLGQVTVETETAASGRRTSVVCGEAVRVEVRPDPVTVKQLVRSRRVRAQAGDGLSWLPGDGIEFAEVREQAAGATERRINWRASARRGTTCVNLFHPERNTDVVLLADTFSEADLPDVIRISANLSHAYLARHDRVGLVCFGGVLDWVEPGSGPAHGERILATLLSSETFYSYAWKGAEIIPRRLVPPGCLVLAVSPLTDERFVRTLVDLRVRGLDLAVLELAASWPVTGDRTMRLAERILELERKALRERLWAMGTALASVGRGDSADLAIARLASVRRVLRRRAPA